MNAEYFEKQRRDMVAGVRAMSAHMAAQAGKTALDERVLRAMAKVPRHEFVPVEVQEYAYLNRPIPIGFDKTISQPLMVAVMTDLLELKPDDVLLEIGTGLGYQAAVLAELAGRVYRARATGNTAAETRGLYQRPSPRRQRPYRLAQARPVRQGDRHSGARPNPSSSHQPAQGWRKDGDPGRPARRPAACRGREGPERKGHNEGNYAGTVLGARGIRPACIPGVLINDRRRPGFVTKAWCLVSDRIFGKVNA
jgi:Protein-L-isoaspartate(D-aspartate) O-methyltransferase (PCMT)